MSAGGTTTTSGGRVRRGSARLDTTLGWSPRFGPGLIARAVLCSIALFVFAAPFITTVAAAFDDNSRATEFGFWPRSPTLLNFEVAAEKGMWEYLVNSLVIAGGGLALQMCVSVFAAYALARRRFRGQAFVLLGFLLTMMLPEEVIAIPLSTVLSDLPVVGLSLRGTVLAVILPVGMWAFSIFVMTEFMKELPVEIEEAARLDGLGDLRMLLFIVLPLCRPALGVIGIFGFLMVWDQYLLPLIAANDQGDFTLPVALSILANDFTVGPGVVLAGSVVALVPSLTVYFCLQSSMVRGIAAGATKG